MSLSYAAMKSNLLDEQFIARVMVALLQTAVNVKILSVPPSGSDTSLAAQRDRLARSIITNPNAWGHSFAPVVSMGFFGVADFSETSITDGAIFSRIDAVYDFFLPAT